MGAAGVRLGDAGEFRRAQRTRRNEPAQPRQPPDPPQGRSLVVHEAIRDRPTGVFLLRLQQYKFRMPRNFPRFRLLLRDDWLGLIRP